MATSPSVCSIPRVASPLLPTETIPWPCYCAAQTKTMAQLLARLDQAIDKAIIEDIRMIKARSETVAERLRNLTR